MNFTFLNKGILICSFLFVGLISAQTKSVNFNWPDTPASKVYIDFVEAYNSGKESEIEKFVVKHYLTDESKTKISTKRIREYVDQSVETWMDYFYRYGPVEPYSININRPFDLEIWLKGTVSKVWFAPEFILNEKTAKVKAVGMLQGEMPQGLTLGTNNESEMLKSINSYLLNNEKYGLIQGTVLIQKGNKVLLNKAFGFKDLNNKERNTVDTRMRISSITKIITSLACLQLVQNGLLDLNTPISEYLPELPSHISNQITITKLLNHTSGYELDNIEGFREEQEKTTSMNEVFELHLKYLPKWEHYKSFKTLDGYNYSNDSYDLVAVIIEKITGMKFEDYLDKYVFKISGMTQTSFNDNDSAKPYRYDLKAKGLKDYSSKYPFKIGKISGAGGLFSTGNDLRLFFNTLLKTEKLLNLPNKSLMLSPSVYTGTVIVKEPILSPDFIKVDGPVCKIRDSRSLGLTISNDQELNIGHNGTSIGNSAEIRYFPRLDYLLIVLCNNRSGAQNTYTYFKNILPNN